MKTPKTWILVADASRARIIQDFRLSPGRTGKLLELTIQSGHRRSGEIMADKPGRSFQSFGSRRSSLEYRSDPEREEEKIFARTVAEMLDGHRNAGDFNRLAVFAAPQMLGDLRRFSSEGLKRATIAEVPKDLTKLPKIELLEAIENSDILFA